MLFRSEIDRQNKREKYQQKLDGEFLIPNGEANDIFLANATDYYTEQEENAESELLAKVYDVIEKVLTADEQYIIREIFFGSKTQKELAAELGISESTLSSRKQSILTKIKENVTK